MIIKNFSELATTKERRELLSLAEVGIRAVQPHVLLSQSFRFDQSNKTLCIKNKSYKVKGRIFVIGGGKAGAVMAKEVEGIIGAENISAGVVSCNKVGEGNKKIEIVKASHPQPNLAGIQGVNKMLALKNKYNIDKDDLVICLLSGGASAILPAPVKEVGLSAKQSINNLLIKSGADIKEINIVRKQLSIIKGGGLGAWFYPTKVISIIISDVVGNDLATIGSGPTVASDTTSLDAYKILKKYKLLNKAPKIKKYLQAKIAEKREIKHQLSNCHNFIIGDLKTALFAVNKKATEIGLRSKIVTAKQVGETTSVARKRAAEIFQGKYKNFDLLILGGETTPRLPRNHGRGGRNQQYALVTLQSLKKCEIKWTLVSLGTDGNDYITGIAGAIIDQTSNSDFNLERAIKKYDSTKALRKVGKALIKTDDTKTNVGDFIFYLLK